jgi:hypothetical protein
MRDQILLQEFIRWLKDKNYVVASESNDSECEQDLSECNYTDELIQEFIKGE